MKLIVHVKKRPDASRHVGGGGGVLAVLQRLVRPRTRPALALPTQAAISTPDPPTAFVTSTPLPHAIKTMTAHTGTYTKPADIHVSGNPTPPPDDARQEDSASDNKERDGDIDQLDDASAATQLTVSTQKSKKKKKKKGRATWVAKLLNQVVMTPKDRVHRKKHKASSSKLVAGECHEMLRTNCDPHPRLWACVFDFLAPGEPSRRCATVNKAHTFFVREYLARYCEWPRPVQYLRRRVFSPQSGPIISRILELLPVVDRVRSSGTSLLFRQIADQLPLVLTAAGSAQRFVECVPTSRLIQRFYETKKVACDSIPASVVVRVLRTLADIEQEQEISIQAVELRQCAGGFESESQFVQLIQALFSDRISLSLHTLVLSDLHLQDEHFRHLARLFYDGRYPLLSRLDLSKNLFSSRFMRDWAKSFREDRFCRLERVNVSGVGMGDEDIARFFDCLRHTGSLCELDISYNSCSLSSLRALARVISKQFLSKLAELRCSAISAEDHAIHLLITALESGDAGKNLRLLDLSGNQVGKGHATYTALAQALSQRRWPLLSSLNLSFTTPTQEGHDKLVHAIVTTDLVAVKSIQLAGNRLAGAAFEGLIAGLESGHLRNLETLNLSENRLGPLEMDQLAQCFRQDPCPKLRYLLLSGNSVQAKGVVRFLPFFQSPLARNLHTLDLSLNSIPSRALVSIAETLLQSECAQLQVLDVSRNIGPSSLASFQKLIRSDKCPSLACLQVGYAHSRRDGYEFVRSVRESMGVDELRRRKQAKFEARMRDIEVENHAKAAQATERCKRQTRLLRERYDHMESVADRALRHRKRVRKSKHLHIHEEIEGLKQAKYRERVRQKLGRALAVV